MFLEVAALSRHLWLTCTLLLVTMFIASVTTDTLCVYKRRGES